MLQKDPEEKQPSRNVKEGKWRDEDVRYRTDRIIVKFKPIPPDSEAPDSEDLIRKLDARLAEGEISEETYREIKARYHAIPDSEATIESVTDAVLQAIPKGAVLRLPRATGRALLSVDPSADIPSLAEKLSKRDDLEYAEPDVVDSEA